MKAKKKRRSNRVASDDVLGEWLLFDASGTYTGSTLWPTRRMAIDELTFGMGDLPKDAKWRIRKVRVRFA